MNQTNTIQRILDLENLELIKRFETGNSGAFVLHTKRDDEELVLKIAKDEKSDFEIEENVRGFKAITQEGLTELLPDISEVKKHEGHRYLLVSFLSEDFAETNRKHKEPTSLYRDLCDRLLPIYKKTLKQDGEDSRFLKRMKQILLKNFREYLFPAGMLSVKEAEPYLLFDIEKIGSGYSCFAVFDFTPEDVYLTENTIKYPDSKPEIRGVPIIDLACFAGVSRDVYELPGSTKGYDLLKKLALEDVAKLLYIDQDKSIKIFNYGRAIQLALSSRFRIKTKPERAKMFAEQSLEYLKNL